MGSIKLVTFDVMNTLLRLRLPVGIQYAQIARTYGIQADESLVSEGFKHSWKVMDKLHPHFGAMSGISWQDWWLQIVAKTFEFAHQNQNDPTCDSATMKALGFHLLKFYSTTSAWEVCPGSEDVLRDLQERKVSLGVITNSDERVDTILTQTGLRHYFHFLVTSYSARCSKPAPGIFLKALKEYGQALKPAQALHIGDSYELDYMGALQANWNAVLVNPARNPLVKPDNQFKDLIELSHHMNQAMRCI